MKVSNFQAKIVDFAEAYLGYAKKKYTIYSENLEASVDKLFLVVVCGEYLNIFKTTS